MATLLLSAAGAAIGGAMGGSVLGISAAVLGRAVGATIGNIIDQRLLGAGSQVVQTGRASSLRIMGGREGAPISRVYGRMRVAGQVIWSTRFKEKSTLTGSGKGLAPAKPSVQSFSYSISFALGLCEGEIVRVGKIWADGKLLRKKNLDFRVYRGDEAQLPDPLIEAIEGAGNAPAFRGVAYLVFEDLALADYGNRIPQITVEVFRRTATGHVADKIQGVALIPGTGEYSLASEKVQYSLGMGKFRTANVNNDSGRTDFVEAVGQLDSDLPNCNSVSLVVSWFGDDLRCDRCTIRPKVEQASVEGSQVWQVSGLTRPSAMSVGQVDGRPAFGGTPSEVSVVQAIQHLTGLGKKVMFYPFVLMDILGGNSLTDPWTGANNQPNVPWRGRITLATAPGRSGSSDKTAAAVAEVGNFFGSATGGQFQSVPGGVNYTGAPEWSYRRFILHYAHLCASAGGVDTFCVGSELRALTQVRSAIATFPTVTQLVSLAAEVRAILGATCKLTYAADWSEYFGYHPQDGSGDVLFHLDPLWADSNIDLVGIDNYMPISDWRNQPFHSDAHWGAIHNQAYLQANIEGGEGFDWYYETPAKRALQLRDSISDGAFGEPWVYRNKDIRNWWQNAHHNRIGGVRLAAPTAWVPQSKPIAFTEIGCPAVNNGANQPNMFFDAKSVESGLPWNSDGSRDDLMQTSYLAAQLDYWGNLAHNPVSTSYAGSMVDMSRVHVWAWDARPWPDFPEKSGIWADARNFGKGHWLNGRVGYVPLADLVRDICVKSGVTDVDVSQVFGIVKGTEIASIESGRQILQPLMLAYGFDGFEQEGMLTFKSRTGWATLALEQDSLATPEGGGDDYALSRSNAEVSPSRLRVGYVNSEGDYQGSAREIADPLLENAKVSTTDLPLLLSDVEGQKILARWRSEAETAREGASFSLPPSMLAINAGDVVSLLAGGKAGLYRVDRIEEMGQRQIDATKVEWSAYASTEIDAAQIDAEKAADNESSFLVEWLDLPLIGEATGPRIAVAADPWPGGVAIYSSANDSGYQLNTIAETPSVIGETLDILPAAIVGQWLRQPLRVQVARGSLESRSEGDVLNGANIAAVRTSSAADWEIIQFRDAVMIGPNTYVLDGILRGQAGTDFLAAAELPAGAKFVLLDGSACLPHVAAPARGLERHYRVGPVSEPYDDVSYQHHIWTYVDVGSRPYAPAHVKALRDDVGAVNISWLRRGRVDGDSWESPEVPLAETREAYRIRIGNGLTWLREAEATSPAFAYDLSQQAADAIGLPYTIEVAQISERFGAGPFARITFNE